MHKAMEGDAAGVPLSDRREQAINLVDRLIAKAQKIKFSYADDVFIISNETGKWMAEGQEFPSFEAAQEYVESLLPDGLPDYDCTVVINDLGPCDPETLAGLAVPYDWLEQFREENRERIRKEREEEKRSRPPEKDRRLI